MLAGVEDLNRDEGCKSEDEYEQEDEHWILIKHRTMDTRLRQCIG